MCKKHPKYQAKRPPRVYCTDCWLKWADQNPVVVLTPNMLKQLVNKIDQLEKKANSAYSSANTRWDSYDC